jgi:hypothetical protein
MNDDERDALVGTIFDVALHAAVQHLADAGCTVRRAVAIVQVQWEGDDRQHGALYAYSGDEDGFETAGDLANFITHATGHLPGVSARIVPIGPPEQN